MTETGAPETPMGAIQVTRASDHETMEQKRVNGSAARGYAKMT